jgi:outer membrane protein
MRKTLIPVVVLAAATLQAQEPAKAEFKPPKIAVIDMGKVSADSLLGKSYAGQLDQLKSEIDSQATKLQNEVQKLEQQIKTAQDELEKQASVLSEDARDRKQQDLQRMARERENKIQDGRAEIQRMQQKAQEKAQKLNAEFQDKIKPQLEAAAKERGIDIILSSEVAIVVNNIYDISQDVIVKADDAERAGKAKAPAAVAPKPAATPAPKP